MPNMAKVFERVVFMQMKLIIPRDIKVSQHGFIPDRNIESNLMELSVIVHDAFQQRFPCQIMFCFGLYHT